jgi:hypothetical protein
LKPTFPRTAAKPRLVQPLVTMAVGSLVSTLIYWVVFVHPFPLVRYYDTIPSVDYAKLTQHSPAGVVSFVAGISVLFAIYVLLLRYLAGRPAAEGSDTSERRRLWLMLFSGVGVICTLLMLAYPTAAIDVLIYAVRTRGWALYDMNPLATAPQNLPGDVWVGLAAEWADAPSPYGPLWEGISRAAFYLAGGRFLEHVLLLKAIAAGAHIASAALVALILKNLKPQQAMLGTTAFALNPLLLLESAGNGHNDILVVLFMLLAVWLSLPPQGRTPPIRSQWLVLPALATAALVKITPVLVLPFFALFLLHQCQTRGKQLVLLGVNAGLAAAVGIGGMLTLWPGWDVWAVRDLGSGAGRSPFALLVLLLRPWFGTNAAFDLTRYLLMGTFMLIYVWLLITASRGPKTPFHLLILPSAAAMFWYIVLPNQQYHAWYLLWPFAFAVLLIPHPLFDRLAILGLTSWLAIPLYETLRVWWWDALSPTLVHAIAVPFVFGIPFLFHLGIVDESSGIGEA